MALVVVQHMDRSCESLLPILLQKATQMNVSQAKDGVRIEPDHVYVIPPNTQMIVSGGKDAIAVILSGMASDGSLGVKAIKSAGGIVFAQDEFSAGHFGMPHSAAATGLIDFVLPPEGIAAKLGTPPH